MIPKEFHMINCMLTSIPDDKLNKAHLGYCARRYDEVLEYLTDYHFAPPGRSKSLKFNKLKKAIDNIPELPGSYLTMLEFICLNILFWIFIGLIIL